MLDKLFGGNAAMLLAVGLAGAAAGAWGAGLWKDANASHAYKALAEKAALAQDETAGALVTLIQNAGRREMNYLFSQEAERRQAVETIETFRAWDALSAEARTAAMARGDKLAGELRALSKNYDRLKQSYEAADANLVEWLRIGVPDDACVLRYGAEACRTDPFARAGYPAPPDRPGAVAEPPR